MPMPMPWRISVSVRILVSSIYPYQLIDFFDSGGYLVSLTSSSSPLSDIPRTSHFLRQHLHSIVFGVYRHIPQYLGRPLENATSAPPPRPRASTPQPSYPDSSISQHLPPKPSNQTQVLLSGHPRNTHLRPHHLQSPLLGPSKSQQRHSHVPTFPAELTATIILALIQSRPRRLSNHKQT